MRNSGIAIALLFAFVHRADIANEMGHQFAVGVDPGQAARSVRTPGRSGALTSIRATSSQVRPDAIVTGRNRRRLLTSLRTRCRVSGVSSIIPANRSSARCTSPVFSADDDDAIVFFVDGEGPTVAIEDSAARWQQQAGVDSVLFRQRSSSAPTR